MSETARPPTTTAGRAGAFLLLAAAVVGGILLVRRPDAPPPRPEPGDVLLETEFPVAPTSRRIRVKMPCTLRVEVTAPAGTSVEAKLGPPLPTDPKRPDDLPEPDFTRAWTVEPGAAPHDEVVLAAGIYVLRVVPSGARAGTMSVKVRALPP